LPKIPVFRSVASSISADRIPGITSN
jgi:hypothetical protein